MWQNQYCFCFIVCVLLSTASCARHTMNVCRNVASGWYSIDYTDCGDRHAARKCFTRNCVVIVWKLAILKYVLKLRHDYCNSPWMLYIHSISVCRAKGILHTFSDTDTDRIWPHISSLLSSKIPADRSDAQRAWTNWRNCYIFNNSKALHHLAFFSHIILQQFCSSSSFFCYIPWRTPNVNRLKDR